ncbi:hypothetical protein J6590_037405 [Homalodisca vitripennis]|nr:hypothetical protein J6590_037405 [Homalodisca vitripennis]
MNLTLHRRTDQGHRDYKGLKHLEGVQPEAEITDVLNETFRDGPSTNETSRAERESQVGGNLLKLLKNTLQQKNMIRNEKLSKADRYHIMGLYMGRATGLLKLVASFDHGVTSLIRGGISRNNSESPRLLIYLLTHKHLPLQVLRLYPTSREFSAPVYIRLLGLSNMEALSFGSSRIWKQQSLEAPCLWKPRASRRGTRLVGHISDKYQSIGTATQVLLTHAKTTFRIVQRSFLIVCASAPLSSQQASLSSQQARPSVGYYSRIRNKRLTASHFLGSFLKMWQIRSQLKPCVYLISE